MLNGGADLVFEQDDELRAEDEAAELPRLEKKKQKNIFNSRWTGYSNPNTEDGHSKPPWAFPGTGTHLVIGARLPDYGETIVIGGGGAEDVHYGAHLFHSVKTCDWRAHDFSVGQKKEHHMPYVLGRNSQVFGNGGAGKTQVFWMLWGGILKCLEYLIVWNN